MVVIWERRQGGGDKGGEGRPRSEELRWESSGCVWGGAGACEGSTQHSIRNRGGAKSVLRADFIIARGMWPACCRCGPAFRAAGFKILTSLRARTHDVMLAVTGPNNMDGASAGWLLALHMLQAMTDCLLDGRVRGWAGRQAEWRGAGVKPQVKMHTGRSDMRLPLFCPDYLLACPRLTSRCVLDACSSIRWCR